MKFLIVILIGFISISCGVLSKESSSSGGNSSTESSETGGSDTNGVSVTGSLNLDSYTDVKPDSVKKFRLTGGAVDTNSDSAIGDVSLGEDGAFSTAFGTVDPDLAVLEAAVTETSVDREALEAKYGSLEGISDDQIREYFSSLKSEIELQGGPMYVLVLSTSAAGLRLVDTPLSQLEAEASTFNFVGLPGSSSNLIGMPSKSAKSDLALGNINDEQTSDESKSDLKLSQDVFDIPEAALETLANSGDILKALKNAYMEKDYSAEPFFMWQGSSSDALQTSAKNNWVDVNKLNYNGYGFYIGVENAPFTFDQICPTDEANIKLLEMAPPSDVVVQQGSSESDSITLNSDNPFNNRQSDSASRNIGTQDGNKNCGGDATGFYARDDGNSRFMINWGTGGSIKGPIPDGIWRLKYDGGHVASFDLATTYPLDADSKPIVFIPSIKVNTASNGVIESIELKLYGYNKTSGALEALTDDEAPRRLIKGLGVDIEDQNGDGYRPNFTYEKDGVWIITKDDIGKDLGFLQSDGQSLYAKYGVAVSYGIGKSNYRFEFRDN